MMDEKKMRIAIDSYFKLYCDANTSIRDAFEKGFRTGVTRALVEFDSPERKREMDKLRIRKAEQILIDNGIEDDEAAVVLQAIGYALLDTELYPDDCD